jgi:uncharacterized protein with HEPN domain
MYKSNNFIYIITILEAVNKIGKYSNKFLSFEDFFWHNDQINFNASVNLLIAIGEEIKKIDKEIQKDYPEIKWKSLAHMRDKLAHDYRGVDPEIVWTVIRNELQNIKTCLDSALYNTQVTDETIRETIKSNYYKNINSLLTKLFPPNKSIQK